MAQEQQEQDRSEPATPFKLREARKKGQVPKSLETNSFAALLVGLLVGLGFGWWAILETLDFGRRMLSQAGDIVFEIPNLHAWFGWGAEKVVTILSPLLAFIVVAAILSNLLQTGPVFTTHPLKPDFTRMNPAQGFKRLFSIRTVYEAVKNVIKLSAYGIILFLVLQEIMPALMRLSQTRPAGYPGFVMTYGNTLLFFMILGVFVLSVLDLAFTRWEFGHRMRMSRRELKEEVKRREGDPQIRARRRREQQELRNRAASIRNVKDSDVLITNPEHVAVALRYVREEMTAPKVTSKGGGHLAAKMRSLARRHNVPIERNPALARALYERVDLDAAIPEDVYPAVAGILRAVYAAREETQ